MRKTLADFIAVAPQESVGNCGADIPRWAALVNLAQEQLIFAGRDTGWWGGWAKVVFNVERDNPYITLPPQFARIVKVDFCRTPRPVQNEWYEFLEAGIGLQTPCPADGCGGPIQAYDRGTVPTAFDLSPANQLIRVYPTDPRDVGKRLLFSNALDANGLGIYTQDALNPVNGFYLTIDQPFVETSYVVTSFQNVAKDITFGDVRVTQVDNDTGEESLLSRYKPNETNPAYRRYFFKWLADHPVPVECCVDADTRQITAMLKYEYVPVKNPSDFLIIANLPALINECESITYSRKESENAQAMSLLKHNNAIRLLRQELDHYMGVTSTAIGVAPWGTAHLQDRMIGTMI